MHNQKNGSVKQTIATCRSKNMCTHFEEPSYIDLHHFYRNLIMYLKNFAFKAGVDQASMLDPLKQALQEGLMLIEDTVIANTAGKNLSNARGISIYFPERGIHPSYRRTSFAQVNDWPLFLNQYMLL
jgi:hypothetical protein